MAVTVDLSAIGAMLRSRTVDQYGAEQGTFNTDTRPTAAQVTSLGTPIVTSVVGLFSTCTSIPEAVVQRLATLKICMQIELTYFPEQVTSGRSAYPAMKDLFDDEYASSRETFCPNAGDGQPGGEGGVFIGRPVQYTDGYGGPGNWTTKW